MVNFLFKLGLISSVAVILNACATTATPTSQSSHSYRAHGWGAASCRQLMADLDTTGQSRKQTSAHQHLYQSWLSGFISGVNYARDDRYDIAANRRVEDIFIWLQNYCTEQPEQDIPLALHELIQEWQDQQ